MLRFSRTSRWALMAIVAVILVFMYAPLSVLILNAFNDRQISAWPIQEWSFKWWVVAFESEAIRAALLNSAIVAFGAMVIAMILGSLVAFALSKYEFFGKGTVNLLVVFTYCLARCCHRCCLQQHLQQLSYPRRFSDWVLRNDRRSRDFLYCDGFQQCLCEAQENESVPPRGVDGSRRGALGDLPTRHFPSVQNSFRCGCSAGFRFEFR